MFSGIVESVQPILSVQVLESALRIQVQKPNFFNDLKIGDSIANNGVCLTVEAFDEQQMTFVLAAESLQVLNLPSNGVGLVGRSVNLERSLRFGDRIHGHLVTGHVEGMGLVTRSEAQGESWFLDVRLTAPLLSLVWKKGSITLNGVSLTVNQIAGDIVSVCLIPETIKRTNLASLAIGDSVNVETDYMAKALIRKKEWENESRI